MQEAVQVEIVNGSKESRLWSEPASIDARYDEEEESRWHGRYNAKDPEEDAIHSGSYLTPLVDDVLTRLCSFLTIQKVTK